MSMNLVEKAEKLAREAHSGQLRKDGKTPYIEHPKEVVRQAARLYGDDSHVAAVAWCHDIIEDSKFTHSDIVKRVSFLVAMDVQWLTNPKYDKKVMSRQLCKYYDRERLSQAPLKATVVKMADRLTNLVAFGDDEFMLMYAIESADLINYLIRDMDKESLDFVEPLLRDLWEEIYKYLPKPVYIEEKE